MSAQREFHGNQGSTTARGAKVVGLRPLMPSHNVVLPSHNVGAHEGKKGSSSAKSLLESGILALLPVTDGLHVKPFLAR